MKSCHSLSIARRSLVACEKDNNNILSGWEQGLKKPGLMILQEERQGVECCVWIRETKGTNSLADVCDLHPARFPTTAITRCFPLISKFPYLTSQQMVRNGCGVAAVPSFHQPEGSCPHRNQHSSSLAFSAENVQYWLAVLSLLGSMRDMVMEITPCSWNLPLSTSCSYPQTLSFVLL